MVKRCTRKKAENDDALVRLMFFGSFSQQVAMSGDGLVTGKHCFFILSYSEEEDNGYAICLRNVMVRIMRIPT